MQSRRAFIKSSCTLCSAIVAGSFIATALNSCGTTMQIYKATVDNKLLNIPIASFKKKNKMLIVRSKELDFDILLIKVSESEYRALLMKCTHRENPLTANDKGLYCASHGSTFDLSGNVIKEPAIKPLKKFQTTISGNDIIINLNS